MKRVADKLQRWPLDRLKAYERNSRTHTDDQIAKVAASITRFGFTNPILATDDGTIVAGHGRLLAARLLGMTAVPVIVVTGWTEDERRAYVIADNQLALEAGWDEEILRLELGDLRDKGFDLGLTGFDGDALAALLDMRPDGAVDPDEAPALPANPVAALGDLWALGRHRLLCGDATSAKDTALLLNGAKPHLMVTDPPYGVDYDPAWRGTAKRSDGKRTSIGVHAKGQVENDDRSDWHEAWALFPGDVVYVWHAGRYASVVQSSLESEGIEIRSQIIWAKNNFAIGRGDYHWQHEPCWYAVRKGKTGHWNGDRKQTTLWEIPKPQRSETGHGTQKPVECMKRPIENNSKPGDTVYDPFCGSGTTIIAAEMTGRKCFALEISPAYVDVAIQRWQTFTGLQATLAATGQTFDQVANDRTLVAA
jgi:DNA modification methylase